MRGAEVIDLITRLQLQHEFDAATSQRFSVQRCVMVRTPGAVWVPWALREIHKVLVVVDGKGRPLGVVEWHGRLD